MFEMAFMSSCITTWRAFVGYHGIDVGILTRLAHTPRATEHSRTLDSEVRCKDYAKPGSKATATDFLDRVKFQNTVHADLGPMISSHQCSAAPRTNSQLRYSLYLSMTRGSPAPKLPFRSLAHWPSETLAVVGKEKELESSLRSADVRALSIHILWTERYMGASSVLLYFMV